MPRASEQAISDTSCNITHRISCPNQSRTRYISPDVAGHRRLLHLFFGHVVHLIEESGRSIQG